MMDQPLPPEVLVELEQLLNDASLPWYVAGDGDWIASAERPLDQGVIVCEKPANDCERSRRHWPKRRALIVAAVNNLRALLDTARSTEAMRAENERMKAQIADQQFKLGEITKALDDVRPEGPPRGTITSWQIIAAGQKVRLRAAEAKLKAAREALERAGEVLRQIGTGPPGSSTLVSTKRYARESARAVRDALSTITHGQS